MFAHSRILVTGGAGFIGSHVAEHYAKKGAEVIVFDNLSRAETLGTDQKTAIYSWNQLKKYSNIKLIKGDIREYKELKRAARDVSIIVHAAAQVAVTTSIRDPIIDFDINAMGTLNLLETARMIKTDPAVIFCSTNKVYGTNPNKISLRKGDKRYYIANEKYRNGIPEDFPIDHCSHTPYGSSKLAGDIYMQDYANTYGLKTAIFRLSCIYGKRQFGVEDQGWVSHFIISSLIDKVITIYGDGCQVRDLLCIDDLICAFKLAIETIDTIKGEVYNVGGGLENTYSLLEFITFLERLCGKKIDTRFHKARLGDQKVYISDIRKAKRDFNWAPKISKEKGIQKLYNWLSKCFSQNSFKEDLKEIKEDIKKKEILKQDILP